MNIPFSPPDITDLEINEVVDSLRSGWITTGPKTKLFEKKIGDYCGTGKAVCLGSATAAMETTLRVLGIGPGDEVITSAYTYTASASVIDHVGARIVLVDVEPGTFHIDYDKLAEAITPRTKVVIPVDIGGVMCDYDRVLQIVESKKDIFRNNNNKYMKAFDRVVVMADAAHSFGAVYRGKKSGAAADFTCFSFHAVKNLTTAEGGAVTWVDREGIDNKELYNDYMLLSLHGQSKDALAKLKPGAWEYDIVTTGYKCNMTDMQAALGLAQINRFDALMAKRKYIIGMYDKAFLPLGIQRLEHKGEDFEGNGHLYLARINGITAEERNSIIVKMAESGIATNVHFKPLPMHTAYKNLGFDIRDYPEAYRQFANEITLPLNTLLTEEQVNYIIDTFSKIITGVWEPHDMRNDPLRFERVWENNAEDIQMVRGIINMCEERMFLDNGLLLWANHIGEDVVRRECIDAMQHTVKPDYHHPELDWVGDCKLIFITAHRRENLGEPMHHMFRAIRRVLDEHPDCKAVYPIHMNPVVRQAADEELGDCDRIHIIEPVEVFDCHNFEARSYLCLTDSGGIQEECPSYGVPVLVMRDTTERPEGVDAGTLRLVGTNEDVIYRNFKELLENKEAYEAMSHACNPYGDGHACERIADILEGKEYSPWTAKM